MESVILIGFSEFSEGVVVFVAIGAAKAFIFKRLGTFFSFRMLQCQPLIS